jgi:hypothetical protein
VAGAHAPAARGVQPAAGGGSRSCGECLRPGRASRPTRGGVRREPAAVALPRWNVSGCVFLTDGVAGRRALQPTAPARTHCSHPRLTGVSARVQPLRGEVRVYLRRGWAAASPWRRPKTAASMTRACRWARKW